MPVTRDPNLVSPEDPDYEFGWDEDPRFLIRTRDVEAAAAALAAAAPRLMLVDADGREWEAAEPATMVDAHTPSFVSDVEVVHDGVLVWADTKSATTSKMAEAMVRVIVEELEAHGVDGLVTSDGESSILWDPARARPHASACRCSPGPGELEAGPGGFFCPDCGGGVIDKNGEPWT
ncbi:hypothetical protein JQN72_11140 [Phycicoccus sp. CSK15P-2]|uniref:hypothetical protein n=1 Tax=Phycicoccus sp. CSK15P-2 TaxID=2807627 RepID=UPI001951A230|nr:hypothetical protein [Phycicoccus sp. CSK15P-2]MBM6404798.1 hypothetical protein [Phycicoccus sp. CSK15P-2]